MTMECEEWIHDCNKENNAFFYNQILINNFVAKMVSSNIIHFVLSCKASDQMVRA